MRKVLLLILLSCLLVAGCNGAKETDEVAWVVSIGVDRAEDGDLLVTYRIANPAVQAAGEAGGAAGKEPSTIMTFKASSLAEARNLLNASISRNVSLAHVTAIVIGEDLARAGVQDLISPLLRFREFRGSTFLIITRNKVSDIFKANKPPIETLVSRWVQNYMRHYDEVAYFLPLSLHEFYTRLKASSGAPIAVAYGINPLSTSDDRSTARQPNSKVKTYLPGDLPRQGGNPTEFAGTAVFREDKLAGFLDTGETRALAILLDKFPQGFIVVTDPLAPKHQVNVRLRNGRVPKIAVDIGGDRPVITIDVLLEGEITAIPSGIAYEEKAYLPLLETQVSNTIHEQILNMLVRTQGWGCDVADFGYYIRPKFLTRDDMWQYRWSEKFLQAEFNIAVKTELRRTGLLRKTREIRREPDR
jgi:spore germination protein KC